MGVTKRILVTGGAGYIGSHVCKQLASAGFEPVVYDNLSRGHRHNVKWGPIIIGDILDRYTLASTMDQFKPDIVMHFAASAYVGESMTDPEKYYRNNVEGSLVLLSEMRRIGIGKIVFSSTCATYGRPTELPITEESDQRPINPYGMSKLIIERIIKDYARAYGIKFAILRYFNACGADAAGELFEQHDPETHLIPRCLMAAVGHIPFVEIYGDDYDTSDGTALRDYIHVTDLSEAHVQAMRHLKTSGGEVELNLGSGMAISIMDIISGIRNYIGKEVPYTICPRRQGDPPCLMADVTKARQTIGFQARHSSLENILKTAWKQFETDSSRK